jgi:endonuclease YncB( thermonuclease family)
MREKFLNLILIIFLGIFSLTILKTANSSSSSKNLPQNQTKEFDKEFSGKVYVIDGDSIKVGDKEVRLLLVDAPEYKQTCFNKNDEKYDCGKISRNFLLKLAHKKQTKCLYHDHDIYGRYLAYCYLDEISINHEILKNGMAVIYDFSQASKEEIELENFAKDNKLGIWQGAFQLPKDYRKSNPR